MTFKALIDLKDQQLSKDAFICQLRPECSCRRKSFKGDELFSNTCYRLLGKLDPKRAQSADEKGDPTSTLGIHRRLLSDSIGTPFDQAIGGQMSCIPPRSAGLAIHPQGKMRSYPGIVRVGVLATMLLFASAACTRPGESLVADLKQLDRDTRPASFDATAVVTAHFRPGTSKAAAIELLRREGFEYSPSKSAKPGEDIIFAERGLGGPFDWFGYSIVQIKLTFDNDKVASSWARVIYRGT